MDFGKLRDKSVKIGKNRKLYNSFGCLPENVGWILLAVFVSDFFLISYIYRVDTEIAEVHTDIERSFLKFIRPL